MSCQCLTPRHVTLLMQWMPAAFQEVLADRIFQAPKVKRKQTKDIFEKMDFWAKKFGHFWSLRNLNFVNLVIYQVPGMLDCEGGAWPQERCRMLSRKTRHFFHRINDQINHQANKKGDLKDYSSYYHNMISMGDVYLTGQTSQSKPLPSDFSVFDSCSQLLWEISLTTLNTGRSGDTSVWLQQRSGMIVTESTIATAHCKWSFCQFLFVLLW